MLKSFSVDSELLQKYCVIGNNLPRCLSSETKTVNHNYGKTSLETNKKYLSLSEETRKRAERGESIKAWVLGKLYSDNVDGKGLKEGCDQSRGPNR